jgi:hypothetical protein
MVALAGIVHDREAAAGHEHNRAEDNQQGSLHVDDLRSGAHTGVARINVKDTRSGLI